MNPACSPPSGGGGAHCLCFVRCWVGVSKREVDISIFPWKYGSPLGLGWGREGQPRGAG